MEEAMQCGNRLSTYHLSLLKTQIIQFSQHQHKNSQYLITFMDQFLAKQKVKTYFESQDFSRETKLAFNQIQNYLSQLSVNLTNFPFLDIFMKIFELIFLQINKLLTYSNERWVQQTKTLTMALNLQRQKFTPAMQVCLRCSQNIKHQQLKSAKHQIYTFQFEDPYYFFQCNKTNQINGQQENQKKLQDKLSELASGVEIGQRYIRQLLAQFDIQQKSVEQSMNSLGINSESQYILPVMPMLRSIFRHTRGAKKQIKAAGIQTDITYKINQETNAKTQKQLKDLSSEKQKTIAKFATQISDKTIQIQNLTTKMIQYQKTDSELKMKQNLLSQQNIMLQRKNSLLEFQINNLSNFKQGTSSKLKKINLRNIQRQKSDNVDPTKNDNSPLLHPQKQTKEYNIAKVRGSADPNSKPKSTFFSQSNFQRTSITPNQINTNDLPIANTLQRTFRKTDNIGKTQQKKEFISNTEKKSSIAIDSSNFNADLPSIRSHSNGKILQEQISTNMNPINLLLQEQIDLNRNQKKTNTNFFYSNINKTRKEQGSKLTRQQLRSYNQSPETKYSTKQGTMKEKQRLLKLLFKRQQQDNQQKAITFQEFQSRYELFLAKTVYPKRQNKQQIKLKQISLYRKDTISNQQKNESQNISKNNQKIQHTPVFSEKEKQQRKNEILIKMKNALFITSLDTREIKKVKTEKSILNIGEMQVMTQIMAYMIQLKANNDSAYSMVKKLITTQEKKIDNTTNQTFSDGSVEEKKLLKQSLSLIIKIHRECPRIQKCFNGCSHLQQFINSIASMIQQ